MGAGIHILRICHSNLGKNSINRKGLKELRKVLRLLTPGFSLGLVTLVEMGF
jgi:hypothetical protein